MTWAFCEIHIYDDSPETNKVKALNTCPWIRINCIFLQSMDMIHFRGDQNYDFKSVRAYLHNLHAA